jgi:hypothetical protein
MTNNAEPGLIQALMPKAAIKTLDKSVLSWLTLLD